MALYLTLIDMQLYAPSCGMKKKLPSLEFPVNYDQVGGFRVKRLTKGPILGVVNESNSDSFTSLALYFQAHIV